MSAPTAKQLADALEDAALHRRDEYLYDFAQHVRRRLRDHDKRLAVLAPHTDSTGYPWLREGALDWRDDAFRERWTYRRQLAAFFTAAATAAPVPRPEELEDAAAEVAIVTVLIKRGWRLLASAHHPGGFVLERCPATGETTA